MQNISKQGTISILAIILALALAYFVTRPVLASLKQDKIQKDSATVDLKKTQDKLSAVKSLKKEFERQSGAKDKLMAALPATNGTSNLLVEIEAMASKNGLDVSSLQPKTGTGKSDGEDFNLAVKGSYKDFVNFLDSMEKNLQPILVKSISLSGAPKGDSSTVSANLAIKAFEVK